MGYLKPKSVNIQLHLTPFAQVVFNSFPKITHKAAIFQFWRKLFLPKHPTSRLNTLFC